MTKLYWFSQHKFSPLIFYLFVIFFSLYISHKTIARLITNKFPIFFFRGNKHKQQLNNSSGFIFFVIFYYYYFLALICDLNYETLCDQFIIFYFFIPFIYFFLNISSFPHKQSYTKQLYKFCILFLLRV